MFLLLKCITESKFESTNFKLRVVLCVNELNLKSFVDWVMEQELDKIHRKINIDLLRTAMHLD